MRDAMNYGDLDRVWFDAVVTGELTHYALWFEEQLEFFIVAYFLDDHRVIEDFSSSFIRSRDFTMARKIDFVKKLLKSAKSARSNEFLATLQDVEEIVAVRNAMAHGRDVGGKKLNLEIEVGSYGGKTKTIEITPDSHAKAMEMAERCLDKLKELKLLASSFRTLRA